MGDTNEIGEEGKVFEPSIGSDVLLLLQAVK